LRYNDFIKTAVFLSVLIWGREICMKVTTVSTTAAHGGAVCCVLAWYITVGHHKILFVTDESPQTAGFWRQLADAGVPMAELDMLFLPWIRSGTAPILEEFLRSNSTASIYLSRSENESFLRAMYDRLRCYVQPERLRLWEERVVFTDPFTHVAEDVQIMGEDQSFGSGGQNMLLCENETQVLFVNGKRSGAAQAQTQAESLIGQRVDCLFCAESPCRVNLPLPVSGPRLPVVVAEARMTAADLA
jgi:hypothetical protein